MSHHTTSPAETLAKAGTHYNPERIANLEATIAEKIKHGQVLAARLFDTHRQRLVGRYIPNQASEIRRQLDLLQDELDLYLSDLHRRRI